MSIIQKLKATIQRLKYQIRIGIKNARKYILVLIESEEKLERLFSTPTPSPSPSPSPSLDTPKTTTPTQLDIFSFLDPTPASRFSFEQIRNAFVEAGGCLSRYWKPEMYEVIPRLVGLKIRPSDPWDWMIQFEPIKMMEELGWRDRHIGYCIQAARILELV